MAELKRQEVSYGTLSEAYYDQWYQSNIENLDKYRVTSKSKIQGDSLDMVNKNEIKENFETEMVKIKTKTLE